MNKFECSFITSKFKEGPARVSHIGRKAKKELTYYRRFINIKTDEIILGSMYEGITMRFAIDTKTDMSLCST